MTSLGSAENEVSVSTPLGFVGTGILHLFAVKAVTGDWSQGRFFRGICPSVPRQSVLVRWGISRREGSCRSPVQQEPQGTSWLLALCSGRAVGSCKARSPLPSSWSGAPAKLTVTRGHVAARCGWSVAGGCRDLTCLSIPTRRSAELTSQ